MNWYLSDSTLKRAWSAYSGSGIMVKLSEEIRKTFEKQRVISLATADKGGRPNVVLVGMWFWADEETLVVADNFLHKTKANLLENPQIALNGWAAGKSYQLKGRVEFQTSGPLYERVHTMATSGQRPLPGKSAVVVHVEEAYKGAEKVA